MFDPTRTDARSTKERKALRKEVLVRFWLYGRLVPAPVERSKSRWLRAGDLPQNPIEARQAVGCEQQIKMVASPRFEPTLRRRTPFIHPRLSKRLAHGAPGSGLLRH